MADVIALRRSTRTDADTELDLPSCGTEWGLGDCHPALGRTRAHRCWTWTGWPHICRCLRCGGAP